MAYAMLTPYGKRDRMISAAAALLRGYGTVRTLTDRERRHLVLLIACRLSCSVTLGAYSHKQAPENEYLLQHAKPGWDALELIWGTDVGRRKEMRATLDGVFERAVARSSAANMMGERGVIDCSDLSFPDPHVVDPLRSVRTTTTTVESKRRKLA